MDSNPSYHFERIAAAISFISENFREQPSLAEIAAHVHLSEAHFQRLFTEWAGTSPKKFLQYISLSHAKKLLSEQNATLADAAFDTGFSSTSRLHDLFIRIEGMTPAEYKNGGSSLHIRYSYAESLFGRLIIASTDKGICYLAFGDEQENVLDGLKKEFPNARFSENDNEMHQLALSVFRQNSREPDTIKLHLKGSKFQLKVWESLLKIPPGKLSTYGGIAGNIKQKDASRAVGTAIGSNPVAFLIPCHRVIRASGHFGGYRWGIPRKSAIIGWEIAKNESPLNLSK